MEQTDKALCVDVYVCVYVCVCRVIVPPQRHSLGSSYPTLLPYYPTPLLQNVTSLQHRTSLGW